LYLAEVSFHRIQPRRSCGQGQNLNSWMQIQEHLCMLASMCTPAVPDDVDIFVRIVYQQLLKKLSDDKAVFPIIESVVPLTCMQVSCHKQVSNSFYFLSVRNMVISPKRIFLPAISLYGCLAFLVERNDNTICRAVCDGLLYLKFFLSNSLSGEYCHRLLLLSLAPDSSKICLTVSMLIEPTTL